MKVTTNQYYDIEKFEKIHDNVVDDIEEMLEKKPEYNINHFYWNTQDYLSVKCECNTIINVPQKAWNIIEKTAFDWYRKKFAMCFLKYYIKNTEDFFYLYSNLNDEVSREVLIWLIKSNIAYAYIGDIYEYLYEKPTSIVKINSRNLIPNYKGVFYIDKYKIYTGEQELYDTWVREQYKLKSKCEPKEGDTVFSIGSFYGETAIWFSKQIGENGVVFSFEASEENARVAEFNILKNSIKNVIIEKQCLWSEKTTLDFCQDYGSSKVSCKKTGIKIDAITLDNYCIENNVSKVDYIKMDVEGSELNILEGAKNTIMKNKPKLAICVYHSPKDFIEIPKYIHKLVPEYKLHLSHKRSDFVETVLFASI